MLGAYLALLVAGMVFALGISVLIGNPQRVVNRAVFAGTLQMGAWLVLWHLTASSREGLFWLRWTCSVGALAPLNFWIVREAILHGRLSRPKRDVFRALPWLVASLFFALIPFSELFIPVSSTAIRPQYGLGYYVYLWGLIGLYLILFRESFVKEKSVYGVERLELKVWIGGGCLLAGVIYLLMFVSTATGDPYYRRLQPLAALFFYAGTAYFITSYKIFDAREIVLVGLRKTALVLPVSLLGLLADSVLEVGVSKVTKWLIFATIAVWSVVYFEGKIGVFLDGYSRRSRVKLRVEDVARRESQAPRL